MNTIPPELQHIVYESIKLLGLAIKDVYGETMYLKIEKLRHEMKDIRRKDPQTVFLALEKFYQQSIKAKTSELRQMVKAYSLMLELINTAEAAFRSFRLSELKIAEGQRPSGMVFVFTSHPTEARSGPFLFIMDKIENLITNALAFGIKDYEKEIFYLLKIAVTIDLANKKKPEVKDEVLQILHTILNKKILDEQLNLKKKGINIFFKTWSGGDKDGNPFVGPETMLESINLSRNNLLDYFEGLLLEFEEEMFVLKKTRILSEIKKITTELLSLKKIKAKDGVKITKLTKMIKSLKSDSPRLLKINDFLDLYPGIVLPLEIREDHELIHMALKNSKLAIALMLKELKKISEGTNPCHYVNSFIISMCMSSEDMLAAGLLTQKIFGSLAIPIVPLFENEAGLMSSIEILSGAFKLFPFEKNHKKKWKGYFEVMLGYSDSTKENGVLPGRLMVEKAAHDIEAHFLEMGLIPLFFHGSGGSINRGGGSVKEQLSWLPKSALNFYKATIQGEMVQRNFHQALIVRSQVNKIVAEFNDYSPCQRSTSETVNKFSQLIQMKYKALVDDDSFQELVRVATPYEFLNVLKIGSRPNKRSGGKKFSIRAIPWTLCWTQTRLLLPIWWGIGSSWSELTGEEKSNFIKFYETSSILQSFIKNLGFTLAKIEFGVWRFHLEHSGLNKEEIMYWNHRIEKELEETYLFFKDVTNNLDFLWSRPWLDQSIFFRSSMIHPLNVLQKIALERNDHMLLRETVTGIACGMLTTG